MIEIFRETKFRPETLQLIERAQAILADLATQGVNRVTQRQLYYQLVARGFIPNTLRSYKNTAAAITAARYAGMVDWDAIVDRTREPTLQSEWSSVQSLMRSAIAAFRLPRWEGQDYYVEVWVEKDALRGVLEPLGEEYHVVLSVNRGYSSASAMKEAAERLREKDDGERRLYVIYVGDFDPSGEDMVRDVTERLAEFKVEPEIEKIALTRAQIQQYRPPPNPVKTSDSRAPGFVALHGQQSWEVDALPPNVLVQLIRDAIEAVLDREKYEAVVERENSAKAKLQKAAQRIDKE